MALMHRTLYFAKDPQKSLTVVKKSFKDWIGGLRGIEQDFNFDTDTRGRQVRIGKSIGAQEQEVELTAASHFLNNQFGEMSNFAHESRQATGVYRTELLTVPVSDGAWILFEVHAPSEQSYFNPPKFPQILLKNADQAPCGSLILYESDKSGGYFSTEPIPVNVDEVEWLAKEVLSNEARSTTALVIGRSADPNEDLTDKFAERITMSATGTGFSYILDPAATQSFNDYVGDSYNVFPNSVRAFQPDLDFENVDDSFRHRYVPKKVILSSLAAETGSKSYKAANKLYHTCRLTATRRDLPAAVEEALVKFSEDSRQERRLSFSQREVETRKEKIERFEGIRKSKFPESSLSQEIVDERGQSSATTTDSPTKATPKPTHTATPLDVFCAKKSTPNIDHKAVAFLEEFKANLAEIHISTKNKPLSSAMIELFVLAAEGKDREHDREELFQLQEEKRSLDNRLEDLETKLWISQEALKESEENEEQLRNKYFDKLNYSRTLEQKFYASQRGDELPNIEQKQQTYDTTDKVLSYINSLEFVEFTGDRSITERLEENTNSQVFFGNFQKIAKGLNFYAKEKAEGATGSIHDFIKRGDFPTGIKNHAARESDGVQKNSKLRKVRTFPVPKEISEDGKCVMFSHFKMGSSGVAPRLHYSDQTAKNGKIYIGYFGPHLPNLNTN